VSLTAAADAPSATRYPATDSVPKPRRRRPSLRRWISPLVILAVWQVASATGVLSPETLAPPTQIFTAAIELIRSGELQEGLVVSLQRVAIGVVIGASAGVLLAVVAGLSRWGEDRIDPPVQMLRTLPHLGLVPLFIIWFGIGETPKIALVALGVAFPLYLNVHGGIRGVDARLMEAASVLGFTRREQIQHVVLPAALPHALVGLRLSLGIAWLTLIVGEQVNADAGLGYLINNAREFSRTDVIVVGLLVYAAMGLITDTAVRLLERRALRWRPVVAR
jgi:sulfonate transport system permease protein